MSTVAARSAQRNRGHVGVDLALFTGTVLTAGAVAVVDTGRQQLVKRRGQNGGPPM